MILDGIDGKPFSEVFLEALDEALISLVGETGKHVIYYHLQKNYSIKREEVPEKLELLVEFLKKFFGYGAKVIEGMIVRKLCVKLGMNPEEFGDIGVLEFLKKIK
ncbi:MAG: hypothetical protein N3F65_03930 [Nitrososphaeria archaeon]|nr:hypothetical protein [Aigarchaeota archaeon]MCX8187741.1 hypothetical protein [Nitrososphaeria archaeon]MDW8021831.1 hypothetical protein [Nitrososphaerota archaeon]